MEEIGSEFWRKYAVEKADPLENRTYLLSGRTALDFIIRDIKAERRINSVMLPSYCCETMIEPLERNGVSVQFYIVNEEGIDYHNNDCDAVLLLDFFGYIESENEMIAKTERNNGKVLIYDSTHKLNGPNIDADYSFCSYRKWMYCNFAEVRKLSGEFCISKPMHLNVAYQEIRDKAVGLKAAYMTDGKGDKQEFLSLFAFAENILDKDYVDYAGEPVDVDMESIIKTRRRNAQYLIDGLRNVDGLKLWKPTIGQNDTPLFVPILVKDGLRNALKEYLTNHSIYCPTHWPLSSRHGYYKELYDEELSLICDQRYSINDMDTEIEVIKGFFDGV